MTGLGHTWHANDHRTCGSREKGLNMTNETLQRNLTDELVWDPKSDSEAIAVVSADDGVVTLRGTVGSFRQKREAKPAAERVRGVTTVNNALDVRVLTEHRREDAELRGDVLQALILDASVPATIDVTVKDGIVTLTGTAQWRYQRDEAEFVTANVRVGFEYRILGLTSRLWVLVSIMLRCGTRW
jgi:osmotically-inducible protein OsmY